jgi:hypothetical protein
MNNSTTTPVQPPVAIEPGMLVWGYFPTHDRGHQWHPAIILRVTKCSQRTVITAALGTSRRVREDHDPSELVCFSSEADFVHTGLSSDTRFNMGGLRFNFDLGTCQEKVLGEINEIDTPTLYRRLILACRSTSL